MKPKRIILLLSLSALGLVLAGGGWWWFKRQDSPPDETTLATLQEYITSTIQGYEFSQATPLSIGDTFPILDYPVLRGEEPDWNRLSVITVGGLTSSSAKYLYEQIADNAIQKIHIVSRGSHFKSDFSQFPAGVIILNGRNLSGDAKISIPSQKLHEDLGIFSSISAYIIDAERHILAAQLNSGDFHKLATAIQSDDYSQQEEITLAIGEALDLSGFEPDIAQRLQNEFTKPLSILFIENKATCNSCRTWLDTAQPFIDAWQQQGYGVILLDESQAQALQERDNMLVVSNNNAISHTWGIEITPTTLLLQQDKLQGVVLSFQLNIDGRDYNDIPFQAIDKILTSLAP